MRELAEVPGTWDIVHISIDVVTRVLGCLWQHEEATPVARLKCCMLASLLGETIFLRLR